MADAPPRGSALGRLWVRAIARLVPRARRADWTREWLGELDAAARRRGGVMRVAPGALRDALTVRGLARRHRSHTDDGEGTMGTIATMAAAAAAELRRAARSLARAPGFTLAAVATLAVGIGATAAIFTLVEAVLLRPLPYPDAERVVRVRHTMGERGGTNPLARSTFAFFAREGRSYEAWGGYWAPASYALADDAQAERIQVVEATPGLLDVLGARTAAGRLFREGDPSASLAGGDAPEGTPCVAVVGHALWQRRYGGDPSLVGRAVDVEGIPCEVIGIMAEGVHLPDEKVDLWIPYAVPAGVRPDDSFRLHVLARLRPDRDLDAARAEAARLTERLPEDAPFYRIYIDEHGLGTSVTPARDDVVGGVESALWIVMGAVLVVMLIAAANIATLFLVRTEGRRQDVTVRSALGAGGGQLLGLFLAESLVVAVLAGSVGLLLAGGAVRLLVSLAPPSIPRLDELSLGAPTVMAALALSLVLAAVLGVYPYLRFGRVRALRTGVRGVQGLRGVQGVRGSGSSLGGVGSALVVGQVALALVLLSGSALLVRSFQHLRAVDPGFDAEGVLVAELSLAPARYPTGEQVAAFWDALLARVEALPGVRRAALGPAPLGGPGCNGLYVEGVELREGEFPPCVPIAWVSPGYWDVLGIPIRRGRAFDASDAAGLPVAILSANAAERLWPGGDPLQGGVHPSPRRGPPWFRVVGVSGAVHGAGPDRPATESLYLPIGSTTLFTARSTELLVAAPAGAATSLAPALRALMAELDPDTPLTVVGTLEERLAASMVRTSFTLFLLGIAALTALALGVVGLYGVVAYRVGARRGEIGIRMAVGAGRGQVRRLVLAHSLGLVGLGTALGLAASFALSGLLDSLLFGVNPGDPGTLALAALTLVATAAAAAWIPAQRATRIDPVEALRGE